VSNTVGDLVSRELGTDSGRVIDKSDDRELGRELTNDNDGEMG